VTGVVHMLEARDLAIAYGGVTAVDGVNLHIDPGEVVALLGPNGSGKTSTLLALSGEVAPARGSVLWRGESTTAPLHRRAKKMGLALVPEPPSISMALTAGQNLRLARCDRDRALDIFPELRDLLRRRGSSLSGGEQQMLSLARALARRPALLVCDELSMGLAPSVVNRLLSVVKQASREGVGVLLVEQHVHKALEIADRAYFLRLGRLEWSATGQVALERIREAGSAYMAKDWVDAPSEAERRSDGSGPRPTLDTPAP
jgi:ABC-type branched-subunit amino acid transport system ATPase component